MTKIRMTNRNFWSDQFFDLVKIAIGFLGGILYASWQ